MDQPNKYIGEAWKELWPIGYCDLCHCFQIACKDCGNSSCNGGGCMKCDDAFNEFNELENALYASLPEEERICLDRAEVLKRKMYKQLLENKNTLDFKALQAEGRLSISDEEMFAKYL